MRDRFRAGGLDTPELDARLLAQKAFGLDAMGLVRKERDFVPAPVLKELDQFAQRRLVGEPVSRIIGRRAFWGLDFSLNDATLDPRPETEMLVQEAVAFLERKTAQRFVDLGTGSGAIAVAIATALPKARGFASDISEDALTAAKQNAERHGVANRITFRQGAWWQAIP
ncbi:MAG TPA: HemK/PrmC family methyltransferase, partial [Devosia sp.]|nr:HemK/PrmC family methyltransferase [Devosia sp.]